MTTLTNPSQEEVRQFITQGENNLSTGIYNDDSSGNNTYWDSNDQNEINSNGLEVKNLLTGPDALIAYKKIKLNAALTNLATGIEYDMLFGDVRVCNTAWNFVKVWKDVDQDGITDEGELVTLENAGVTGINLNYTSQNTTDVNNNEHKQTGTFTTTDNTTSTITDVWFDAELSDTKDKTEIELSETISALPDIEGWGNVHNLINVNDNQVLLLMSV